MGEMEAEGNDVDGDFWCDIYQRPESGHVEVKGERFKGDCWGEKS